MAVLLLPTHPTPITPTAGVVKLQKDSPEALLPAAIAVGTVLVLLKYKLNAAVSVMVGIAFIVPSTGTPTLALVVDEK